MSANVTWICPPSKSVSAWGYAAIWNVHHVDASHDLEQFAGYVGRDTIAPRPHAQLLWMRVRIGSSLRGLSPACDGSGQSQPSGALHADHLGYWFTASTSFANPAVTIARSLRHIRGHRTGRRCGFHRGAAPRHARRCHARPLAVEGSGRFAVTTMMGACLRGHLCARFDLWLPARCLALRRGRRGLVAGAFRRWWMGNDDSDFNDHLPKLWNCKGGNHANGRLPVFLQMHRVRRDAETEAGRLLRVLLLRRFTLSADTGSRKNRLAFLLLIGPGHTGRPDAR
jgi:hypothetical protein